MSHLQNCSLKIYLKRALGGGGGVGGGGGGGQDGCERRIKFFVKIQKTIFFLGGGSGGGVGGGGVGGGGVVELGGIRVDVNKELN